MPARIYTFPMRIIPMVYSIRYEKGCIGCDACEVANWSVAAALGRVLAVPQISAITVPPLDNSAMDGYAVLARLREAGDELEDRLEGVFQRASA